MGLSHKNLENYILAKPGAKLDYPFGEGVAVYKIVTSLKNPDLSKGKMFALIAEKSDPLRISLKCDPLLAQTLREKYESVMPGYHLNKKHWNTIICSGQLSDQEIYEFIDHSYTLVFNSFSFQDRAKVERLKINQQA
ncbi:MmcQ/YjbR family DNA-binding protein [Candidatus Saccharibacteria bacterium CPR2]|nr:MmcQ/YjbR family DNA-binding protein [Candidatus Saccharibacteria bacterium CPR2]